MPVLKPVAPGGEKVLTVFMAIGLIGVMCQIIGMVTMEWITGNGFKTGLFVFEGAGQTVRIPDDNMCDTGKHMVHTAQIFSVLAGAISVFYAAFVVMDVVKNLQREPAKVLSSCLGGSLVCLLFLSSTATWGIWLGQYHKNPCGDLSSAAAVMPNMPSLPNVENLPQMPQMPQMPDVSGLVTNATAGLPQMPDVSGLVSNATAGLTNMSSMLPNATAGLPDVSGILGNATAGLTNVTSGFDPAALANMSSMLPNGTGFDPAALANMSSMLPNGTGFDPAALVNMSGMLSNPAALIPGASGTFTNAPAFNPAGACTTERGRCGPQYNHCSCVGTYSGLSAAEYCNEANGWCGVTAAHRAESSTKYDYTPPGNMFTNAPALNPAGLANSFTMAPALNPAGLANSFTMAPGLNPAGLANMTGTFTMPPLFNQGMAGWTMPPLSLAAVNGVPGLSLDKTLGFSFVFYVIGSVLSIAAFLGHLVKRSIYGDSPLSIAKQIDLITDDKQVDAEASYQSYAPKCQPSPLSSASRASTPPVSAAPSLLRSTGTPPVVTPTNSAAPSLGRSTGRVPVSPANSGPQVTPVANAVTVTISGQLPSFPVPTAPEASPRSNGSRFITNERTMKL